MSFDGTANPETELGEGTDPSPVPPGTSGFRELENRVLAIVSDDAEIVVASSGLRFQGKDEIRSLLRSWLTALPHGGAALGIDRSGRISTLTLAADPAPVNPKTTRWGRVPWFAPLLGGALVAALPALATFIGIAFELFPAFEPADPPETRSVTLHRVELSERDRELGDGRIADAFLFEVETVGYDADLISVEWLMFDASSRQRLEERRIPLTWGKIDTDTRADRVTGEILAPPPSAHMGCVVVRVVILPVPPVSDSGGPSLLLDVADSLPYDPVDPANPDCPDEVEPGTVGGSIAARAGRSSLGLVR